jgi:ATP-dependent helicase HrpB
MLPVLTLRDAILDSLRRRPALVLSAPTGSGKTTQVPQILLGASGTAGAGLGTGSRSAAAGPCPGEIVVLQPRRLAARLVARRIAAELGSAVGQLVGYQTRHESCVSPQTRIRLVTEGLFLRQFQARPTLPGVSAVILDEFHERNLATDVSLALLRQLQRQARPDLKIIVMSATLDVAQDAAYLDCPALETHGRQYPVDITYRASRSTAGSKSAIGRYEQRGPTPVWDLAAAALAEVLADHPAGDVLIFMPGGYEIRRTLEACRRVAPDVDLLPLYSDLPESEQDRALAPTGRRKVIVATNVAETSITIEGITHVIDSGLARTNRFDPLRGINILEVEPVSQASAQQRAGRAGRTGPGTCLRLWSQTEHARRPAQTEPEIRRLDLAEVLLQLLDLGCDNPAGFPWLEPPEPQAVDSALAVLAELGAIEGGASTLRLTPVGQRMARLPMHPRLSRLLVEAQSRNCLRRACLWAALISEREVLIRGRECPQARDLPPGFPQSDFLVQERALELARQAQFDTQRCLELGLHAPACREVDRTWRLYERAAEGPPGRGETADLARCLLVAYPDHLAVRRNDTNLAVALTRGRRGELDPHTVARQAQLVLAVELSQIAPRGGEARTTLGLVTEIDAQWLREVHPRRLARRRMLDYNPRTHAVEAADVELYEDLEIGRTVLPDAAVDRAQAAEILAERIAAGELKLEGWDESVEQWLARVRCVAGWFPDRRLPSFDATELRVVLEELCAGAIRAKDLADRPVLPVLRGALSPADQQFVERMAPERIALPRGWRMKITYAPGQSPRGRAKIQDLYGLQKTPTVAGGRVPVLLEILAPNMRPVQTTEDLAGFWERLYPELRKSLSRRYPRHEWR